MISKINFCVFDSSAFNFDEFKSGGLVEKHAVAIWNLGSISVFA
jgi:hypothetical protein